ncbi:hypothetical protein [Kluyvera genomosp. 1]|uniref:hypothetical protein n=1 Tax=Kluyvera genomosp. 1 TaxID=2774053 RepID=UPI0006925867|nr:hypothetical protein [Kluyvera genomosp. 1]
MKIIVASAIVSVAAILSAAMISGNVDFKTQNIIRTDNGHVNLGKVYSESSLVDVVLSFSDDKTVVFTVKDLSSGSYMNGVDNKVQALLDSYNKDKTDDKKLTKETLTFKVPATLSIQAHTEYRSENFPSYDLMLNKKEVNIDKGTIVYTAISSALLEFMSTENMAFKSTYFIQAPKSSY